MEATNPATYGTSYLLTSKTGSQSWWRPQIKGQNVDEQVCFLGFIKVISSHFHDNNEYWLLRQTVSFLWLSRLNTSLNTLQGITLMYSLFSPSVLYFPSFPFTTYSFRFRYPHTHIVDGWQLTGCIMLRTLHSARIAYTTATVSSILLTAPNHVTPQTYWRSSAFVISSTQHYSIRQRCIGIDGFND